MAYALVTGANRGIGLDLCRLLQQRNEQVIAVCRKSSPELDRLGVRVETGVDVTSDEAVAALAARLEGLTIQLLINNAGLLGSETLEQLDLASIRRQFEVNSLGPLRVSQALLRNLGQGAKLILITSRMGSLADNTSGGYYGYRMSKAALNMAGVSLAQDLRPLGIAVGILHPGYVRTGMTGNQGAVEPADAAAALLQRIDALDLGSSGGFWHANGEQLPW